MTVSSAPPSPREPLAFLVKRFPRLSETFVLNEFLELRRQGVDVRLFALMDSGEKVVQPAAEALRSEVVYLGPARYGRMARYRRMARVAAAHRRGALRVARVLLHHHSRATIRHLGEALILVGHMDRMGARHLHAHFAHSPTAVAHLAHLLSGVAFSFTTHAKDLYTTPDWQLARRHAAASFVVTCTAANARYLEEAVGAEPGSVIVCRHGVDLPQFLAGQRRPVPGRILSIGRLVPKKGFDTLIRSCALLRRRGVAFQCRIIGDGPLREELGGLVASLDLAPVVELTRSRPQPELLGEYARADVFALAPRVMGDGDRDGVPNVILEAMAVGAPVVATAISGIPEVVEHDRTGLLVPPDDPGSLADALERVLTAPEVGRRLGDTARSVVAGRFDLTRCVEPLTELFTGRRAEVVASGVGS